MVPGESCGFPGIVGAEGAWQCHWSRGRADDVDRVPVGVAHDELGTGGDIDQGQVASRQPGLLEQLASRGLLEAGRPVTNKHAGGDHNIVWSGMKRVCRN